METLTETLGRIHEQAKFALAIPGVYIPKSEVKTRIINRLHEAVHKMLVEEYGHEFEEYSLTYYDDGRFGIPPEFTQLLLDKLTPKSLPLDPGFNSMGLGGPITCVEEKNNFRNFRPDKLHELQKYFRNATYEDLKNLCDIINQNRGVIAFTNLPLAPPATKNFQPDVWEMIQIMDERLPNDFLKFTDTSELTDEQIVQLGSRQDWVHLLCPTMPLDPKYHEESDSGIEPGLRTLAAIPKKLKALIRSAESGATLGLSTFPQGGVLAPQSLDGLLTYCHAEVLLQIIVAQIFAPGVTCIHCGLPCPTVNGQAVMGSVVHNQANGALARLNIEITGLPSCQTGGSNSLPYTGKKSLEQGQLGRNMLRDIGVHMIRYAFGAGGNFTYFNFNLLMQEIKNEKSRNSRMQIFIPSDPETLDVIGRNADTTNYKEDMHTLEHFALMPELSDGLSDEVENGQKDINLLYEN